ncbi:unnamed protein product, partial [Staurois parvus]
MIPYCRELHELSVRPCLHLIIYWTYTMDKYSACIHPLPNPPPHT